MVKESKGWSPYTLNGGTVVAVAGDDFCIVAGDTRVSHGYSIGTREGHRVTKLYASESLPLRILIFSPLELEGAAYAGVHSV